MKIYLLGGIDFFSLEGVQRFHVAGFDYRTGDSEQILKELMPNEEMWLSLGTSNLTQFTDTAYFFKAIDMVPGGGYKETITSITMLEDMFEFLWFVKDNCSQVSYFIGYNEFRKKAVGQLPSMPYSMADNQLTVTSFTKSDLDFSYDLLVKWLEITNIYKKLAESKTIEVQSSKGRNIGVSDFSYHDLNRIDRAIAFVQNARTSKYLFSKVANYVGALECLFSAGDKNEVQHKIGERIAIYVGKDYTDKMRMYKEYKTAYEIRSRYVHGQDMEGFVGNKEKNLIQASVNMDNLARQILIKVIQEDSDKFLLKSDEQKEWFNSNLFK